MSQLLFERYCCVTQLSLGTILSDVGAMLLSEVLLALLLHHPSRWLKAFGGGRAYEEHQNIILPKSVATLNFKSLKTLQERWCRGSGGRAASWWGNSTSGTTCGCGSPSSTASACSGAGFCQAPCCAAFVHYWREPHVRSSFSNLDIVTGLQLGLQMALLLHPVITSRSRLQGVQ